MKRSRSGFYRFLLFLKPYWRKGLLALVLTLLSVGLQLPMPFLTRYLLDHVIAAQSFRMLNVIGLVLIGTLIANEAASFFQSYLLTNFRGRVLYDIRLKLFDQVQRASLAVFHKRQTGYLMSRISDDVRDVQGLLANTIIAAIQNVIIFVAGIICTLTIHPRLALICFSILPVYLVSLAVFNKRVRNLSRENQENNALVQKDLQELLSGISVIKAFTAEGRSLLKLASRIKHSVRAGVRLDIVTTLAAIVSALISATGPIVLIWYGCGEIMRGRLTVGGLLAFNAFISYLFGPVRMLFELNLGVQRSLAAVERITEILDVPRERDEGDPVVIEQGRVAIERVSFGYGGGAPVLRDLDLIIEPRSTVALVGRSGAGKTTLASLLLKFYLPDSGRITIDGHDLRGVRTSCLRRQVGLVAQDTFLFSLSIRDNIRFGKPDATDDEVERAAHAAFAHDFIRRMPDGYGTIVGERGCTLSGGQRQRIAIARAMLTDPRILILDEATSQVDNESERLIQAALERMIHQRTTIIIAHRLSTVRQADKIVVMESGRIVEQGSHQDLLDAEGAYRELYRAGAMAEADRGFASVADPAKAVPAVI